MFSPVLIPILTFITTALVVVALMPQRQTGLQARLAPYGTRVVPSRERFLSSSFVERVLAPASQSLVRLGALFAPGSIRAKAAAELAAAGDPFSVEQYLAIRTAAMVGAPLLYLLYASRSGQSSIMTLVWVGALFMVAVVVVAAELSVFWTNSALALPLKKTSEPEIPINSNAVIR